MSRPANVVHEDSLSWDEQSHGPHFAWRRKKLAIAGGGRKLGCSLYELSPGRRSWPYHYHCANEEAIYVLGGNGTLRLAGQEVPIAQGDYIALPTGADHPHQIINTSDAPLRYLCFSTMIEPDISVYPDSNKFGLFAGAAPGAVQRTLTAYLPADAKVDYWEGEE
ncbi:MAG: cupin domain-containing protein [Candidatus Binatia bacterium]